MPTQNIGKKTLELTINGEKHILEVEPRQLLVHLLREGLGLTGTHIGCDTSQCGACTILVNGKSTKSCTLFAIQADGCAITTIEGIAANGNLHPLQEYYFYC